MKMRFINIVCVLALIFAFGCKGVNISRSREMIGILFATIFRIPEVEVHPEYIESYPPFAVEVAAASSRKAHRNDNGSI